MVDVPSVAVALAVVEVATVSGTVAGFRVAVGLKPGSRVLSVERAVVLAIVVVVLGLSVVVVVAEVVGGGLVVVVGL